MNELLKKSKKDLLKPTRNARRKLLLIMNVVYILATIVFLTSEKLSQGEFVPLIDLLYYVYIPALGLNLYSLIYNIAVLKKEKTNKLLDKITAVTSMVSIMFMSFCNMNGFGNPSNDAIITDYALGHTLILISVIVVGRKLSFVWFLIVVSTLTYNSYKMGWDFRYHYLTPTEVVEYEKALDTQEDWAIKRKTELQNASLESPNVARYFNTWIIFIIVSFLTAIFFSGITLDIIKTIPSVVKNIESSIVQNTKIKEDLDKKNLDLTQYGLRMLNITETFEKIDLELEKLDYSLKKEFKPIISKIRENIQGSSDWENFKTAINAVHTDFFSKLQTRFEKLSDNELKHLAYIKLGFSNHEIAQLLRVKNDSRRSLRYRLKKKLDLSEEDDLKTFLDRL